MGACGIRVVESGVFFRASPASSDETESENDFC